MNFKKTIRFFRKNILLVVILLTIFLVGLLVVKKSILQKENYLYVKVKLGQGLWWATTEKPANWLAYSINKGDIKYDLVNKKSAEVLEVHRYPAVGVKDINRFDVFYTLRLTVNYGGAKKGYTYDRSVLSIGSPIDIQFPTADLSGTVVEMSTVPFKEKYVEKILTLVNQGGYQLDSPYRYDSIKVGDTYSDGQNIIFEVLDKYLERNIWTVQNNLNAEVYQRAIDSTQNIVIRVRIKLKEKDGGLYYGEENRVATNGFIPLMTKDYFFDSFVVRKIE